MWNSSGHLKLCLFLLRWLNSVESNLVTLSIEILQIYHIHSMPIEYGYVTFNKDPHYSQNLVKINTTRYNQASISSTQL